MEEKIDINNIRIFTHSSDMDGWTCRIIAQKFIKENLYDSVFTSNLKSGIDREIIYHPVNYNEYNFEDIQSLYHNKNYLTIIADFSFNKDEMFWLFANSSQMIWADHHETAIPTYDTLMNFAVKNKYSISRHYNDHTKLITAFDKHNLTSGCFLLYNLLFNSNIPEIITYISNADIGIYNNLNEQYIMAYLKNTDVNFVLTELIIFSNNELLENIKIHGKLIFQNYLTKYKYDKSIAYITKFQGHRVALVAISKQSGYLSFLLNNLSKEIAGYSITYYDNLSNKTRHFSLRSANDIDVSRIAIKYGGGGHKNSAGFIIPLNNGIKLVNEILDNKEIK
jgi:oligoribonuclease NrnB/cAMP/cGMP phosphodiesterase (DHH superfamily)